jgi:hypothetical protein
VTKPGVYKMQGDVSLLQAIAMAEGPTRIADLKSVAVFRTVRDRSMVAVFDLRAIRSGQAADPSVLGDDVIVVDTSQMSARMQDLLQALPALASFFYYAQNKARRSKALGNHVSVRAGFLTQSPNGRDIRNSKHVRRWLRHSGLTGRPRFVDVRNEEPGRPGV